MAEESRMQSLSRVLASFFVLFTCCSSIPVTEFIGFPFNTCNQEHGIFPSNDDNYITVGLTRGVEVNGMLYNNIHVRFNY